MLEAALWGLITSSSLLVGAWLSFAFRPGRRVVGLTMGFGAGALISAVAYDLVLDAFHERVVWPALAHRFPCFEAAKCHRTWAGLYEVCTLDGNAIIGNWPGHFDNFHQISGFSGHGMMHAPAAGRALAELVIALTGSTSTLEYVHRPRHDHDSRLPDTMRARDELGWQQRVSLEDGLQATIKDFRGRLGLESGAGGRALVS